MLNLKNLIVKRLSWVV